MPDTTFVMRMRSPAVTVVRAHPRRCATLVPAVQTTREPPARGVCTARSRVAQSAERPAVNRQVVGSIPTAGARKDHLPANSLADLRKLSALAWHDLVSSLESPPQLGRAPRSGRASGPWH